MLTRNLRRACPWHDDCSLQLTRTKREEKKILCNETTLLTYSSVLLSLFRVASLLQRAKVGLRSKALLGAIAQECAAHLFFLSLLFASLLGRPKDNIATDQPFSTCTRGRNKDRSLFPLALSLSIFVDDVWRLHLCPFHDLSRKGIQIPSEPRVRKALLFGKRNLTQGSTCPCKTREEKSD
ncbi:MAG: hypothetical protein BYD32DRAFT_110740 [Podila humilis]|nr:MAG: hypothetical protein BYD32DRAFT_110740 [Podila humilis]